MIDIFSSFNDIQKVIDILTVIKNKINNQTEMLYTFWENPQEAIDEINDCVQKLQAGDTEILKTINMLFLVTGPFQEMSMQNGWSDEYLKMGEQFDKSMED
jgi:hypothetical protein